jgi:hypothetical protein
LRRESAAIVGFCSHHFIAISYDFGVTFGGFQIAGRKTGNRARAAEEQIHALTAGMRIRTSNGTATRHSRLQYDQDKHD